MQLPTPVTFLFAVALVYCQWSVNSASTIPKVLMEKPKLRFVGNFTFKKPAFITAHENPRNPGSLDLIISSFGVSLFGPPIDGVHYIPDIAKAFAKQDFRTYPVGKSVVWPNEVSLLDNRQLVAPGGFLVPGKKGHISIMDYDNFRKGNTSADWTRIVSVDKGFFHQVLKVNVYNGAAQTGDNGQRMVSCRGWKGVLSPSGGEMVYLEPVGDGKYEMRTIGKGCDCFFTPIDLNGDGVQEFIVPAFFGERVFLMWTEHPQGDYSQPQYIRQRVIDDTIGAAFHSTVVDLDGDGEEDILLTNHQNGKKGAPPSVYAYRVKKPAVVKRYNNDQHPLTMSAGGKANEISSFMEQIEFERFTLASDFPVITPGIGSAAPGGAQASYPNTDQSKYPHRVIIVSGDGSEKAYLLERASEDPRDPWSYDKTEFHDCKGTVGGILVKDVDADGWMDIFVPCYDRNYVSVYTFAP